MTVNDNRKYSKTHSLRDIPAGECFEYINNIFIKTQDTNLNSFEEYEIETQCVDISSGEVTYIKDNETVIPIKVTCILEDCIKKDNNDLLRTPNAQEAKMTLEEKLRKDIRD